MFRLQNLPKLVMFFNPNIPTVEFQQLLETDSEKRIASIHGNFLPSFASYHTLRLQKRGFLYETGYLRGFKFSSNVLHVFFRFLSQSIDCEYNSLDFEGQTKSISKTKSSQMRWKTYIHAYKPGGAASRASATQNVLFVVGVIFALVKSRFRRCIWWNFPFIPSLCR